jgi:histone deacetylase 1/2
VFDRVLKSVELSQPNYASKLAEYGIDKGASTPATADFFYESEEDQLLDLEGQTKFRSLNAYLMYGSKRTYPEISIAVVTLSKKYNKATVRDMKKVIRVAQYVYGCSDSHCLRFRPKSLQLVAMSDASDGVNVNGRGQSGGVVGFESDCACWVSWVCKTQPVVAQSSGEAELIAVNTVGNLVEWARQLMEELGFPQRSIVIYQDSECSLKMLKKGTGSFKRAKHIKIRYFWLKDLIDAGAVVMKYLPTTDMIADIFTKAISGAQFHYLCSLLMGWVKLKSHVASEEVCRE